ncbi:MAG: hypothetical protein VX963_02485 [Actinomycetota bacterium]|nr:hypothetical protein [Actinomycetota bacterium]
MAYTSALTLKVADLDTFIASWNDYGREASLQYATDVWVSQSIMSGERAGEVSVLYRWNSIDSAMDGVVALRNDDGIRKSLGDSGAETVRRVLVRVDAEMGERGSKYSTLITSTGMPPSPEDQAAAVSRVWEVVSRNGAIGQMWGQAISAGPMTGTWILATHTDSLDQLLEGTAEIMASAEQQQFMADHNIVLTGRTMSRNLG